MMEVLTFIDIVTQDVCLLGGLDDCGNGIVPVMEKIQHFALSTTGLIRFSFWGVALSEPVCSPVAHGGDAELIAFAPCPCLKAAALDMGNTTPAGIAGIFWLSSTEQL